MSDDNIVDFRRGPHVRGPLVYGHDWTDSPERIAALRVPCRDCRAAIDQPCVTKDGVELTRFPAHPRRMLDAQGKESV